MSGPNIELSNNVDLITGGKFGVTIDGINGPATVNGDLTVSGNLTVTGTSVESASNATAITITSATNSESYYPTFVSATTGNLAVKVNSGLTFNPNTHVLTTTTFAGALTGNASGSAATVTTAAQPTITSVGTLTSLTVSGLTTVGINAKSALPSATTAGQVIYVSDAAGLYNTGSLCFSIATGTGSWIDVTTGNIVI